MLPTKLFVPCKNALAYKRQGFSIVLLFKYQHDSRRGLKVKKQRNVFAFYSVSALALAPKLEERKESPENA